MTLSRTSHLVGYVAAIWLLPLTAFAQSETTGAIAGVVRDTSGAVLPGVTVEAASPALIERVRSVVTDSQGQYKVIDLRPGPYSVTFTLPGFSTVRREGLELNTGVTLSANAELRIAAVAEVITVTGASPVVDVQNTRTQNVLPRTVLDALPTGRSLQSMAALTLGAKAGAGALSNQDVGGNKGENFAAFGVHGTSSGDARMTFDGMQFNGLIGGGGIGPRQNYVNQMAVQEVVVVTRSPSAELELGGPQINNVPKDGGNRFSFTSSGTGAGPSLQSDYLPDDLRQRGLASAPAIKKVWDFGFGLGGPIKTDRIWFYGAARWWGAQEYAPGNYYQDRTAPEARGGLIYVPDLSRPAHTNLYSNDYTGRVSWQASRNNRFAFVQSYQIGCNCFFTVDQNRSPEAAPLVKYPGTSLTQGTWKYTPTNRILIEAGALGLRAPLAVERLEGVDRNTIPMLDLATGRSYNAVMQALPIGSVQGAYTSTTEPTRIAQLNERIALSYVTGSHAFKAGLTMLHGWMDVYFDVNDPPVRYEFNRGVPSRIQQFAAPLSWSARVSPNLGVFVQDQWTLNRVTMNLGVRWDHLRAYTPPEQTPAGLFVPARDFPGRDDLPNWNDVNPRVGVAYDLFGNGRTAVKGSIGRYVGAEAIGLAANNHPAFRIATNAFRTWSDDDRDFSPDCDLRIPTANGECGQLSNLNLGRLIPTTTYADDVLTGFAVRPYHWQGSVNLQHELAPNVALTAGYYRTWFGNFRSTDNRAVAPSNFDPYCIAAPVDPRLPGGGGNQLCGLYDIQAASFGRVDNLIAQTKDYGEQSEVYNGIDLAVQARFGQGGLFQGGIAGGRTVVNNCVVVDSPQASRPGFCKTTLPFKKDMQLKFQGVYPLPWWDLQTSATLQNLPGFPLLATYSAPNAAIAPSLGRSIGSCGTRAGCTDVATVDLIPPFTMFEDRLTQLDFRMTKIMRFGRGRVQGTFDIYNMFNSRAVLRANTTYGPAWLTPTAILGGRMFKFGFQADF